MIRYLVAVIVCVLAFSYQGLCQNKWSLVFENDSNGKTISGNKADLIEAVRQGKPVRIGWNSKRVAGDDRWVEHVTEVKFLTILSGNEVMAQIDEIVGQMPDFENQRVLLKENFSWVMIGGTNGQFDAYTRNMISGEIINHRTRMSGFKWWVQQT